MSLLHDNFNSPFGRNAIEQIVLPDLITGNLKPGYGQRAYQTEAFKRFICFWNTDFPGKPGKPYHLLYNMATGSGKTLVMAGLILFLYEKGYRNFLFFVSSTNVIDKTRDNFLNPFTQKYLFNNKIVINNKEVFIKETGTFESADTENINIKFTTTQLLHSDLIRTKENSVTFEDFKDQKIVLIADEAHHLNSGTKKGDLFGSWEGTILEILRQNSGNILLEFTATLDHENKEIAQKYENKTIYKYGLAEFRADKYSKEINLVRSLYNEKERIIQALLLNLYRQELAASHGINLKPVILFKAKKTIKESERNKTNFHTLIEEMSPEILETIRTTSTVQIVQKAFAFFETHMISLSEISKQIKWNFREENCISANNDKEAELNQIRLNTLESENNPIRAVFAVQKLNEGWDVLNLFDIVRLYEGQNSGGSNKTIGATTLSEAQLIGRGARYFPFTLEDAQDKFRRKYDDDPSNDLKILEELYYHTKEDSRYISELKKALISSGIYDDEARIIVKQLNLKPEFKETDLYKTGKVVFNKKVRKDHKKINSLADLGILRKNYRHQIASGLSKVSRAFNNEAETGITRMEKDFKLSEIPVHIIRSALAKNHFFNFDSLQKIFPNIQSMTDFINDTSYLGDLKITFINSGDYSTRISHENYLLCIQELLRFIEEQLKNNDSEYEGSEFVSEFIHKIFKDKIIKLDKNSEREDGQEELIRKLSWYAHNANYGTSEEKGLIKLIARIMETLKEKFQDVTIIRNERTISITDRFGKTFEPDFILFCKGEKHKYQVFIEAKGNHLMLHDRWKEDFLKEIRNDGKEILIHSEYWKITALPFYNYDNENEFVQAIGETLV